MVNERKTEQLVRKMLRDAGYYDNKNIIIEEQSSDIPKINKLLKLASKSGKRQGRPEFIISFHDKPDELILIECKARTDQHESDDKKKYNAYAVDGVLLYADYLKDSFDVTAIAVSGETEQEKRISTFLWMKNNYHYKNINNKSILRPDELKEIIKKQKQPIKEKTLINKAIEYNERLYDVSIPENERCIVISSILVALQNKKFINNYQMYKKNENIELIEFIIKSCEGVLKKKNILNEKRKIILFEYSKYKNNEKLTSEETIDEKTKKKFLTIY